LRRLVAILNPQADRGRTALLADSLRRALCGRLQLELWQTSSRGDAVELARRAALEAFEAVIAIGGDGTVHEIVNGLMTVAAAERPALGVVPAGSGNDVAYALGIDGDLDRTIARLQGGQTRRIDVGLARASDGQSRYCVNNVGALLEGDINLASHRLTWPRGAGLYLRAMLQTLLRRPPVAELQLFVDEDAQLHDAIMLSIANGPRSGGKFLLMPDARVDDGQFDYILATPVSRPRLLWKVRQAFTGRPLKAPWIEQGRFSLLTVRSDIPLAAHVDGEPWLAPEAGVHELTIEVLAGAIRVLCD
jgi:YegS/Rv2252/BmrU family lipid kinase